MWYTQEGGGTRYSAGLHYFPWEVIVGGKLPSTAVVLPDDDYIKERNKQIGAAQVAANAQHSVYFLEKNGKKASKKLIKEAAGSTEIEEVLPRPGYRKPRK
jgi:hypothetical protein